MESLWEHSLLLLRDLLLHDFLPGHLGRLHRGSGGLLRHHRGLFLLLATLPRDRLRLGRRRGFWLRLWLRLLLALQFLRIRVLHIPGLICLRGVCVSSLVVLLGLLCVLCLLGTLSLFPLRRGLYGLRGSERRRLWVQGSLRRCCCCCCGVRSLLHRLLLLPCRCSRLLHCRCRRLVCRPLLLRSLCLWGALLVRGLCRVVHVSRRRCLVLWLHGGWLLGLRRSLAARRLYHCHRARRLLLCGLLLGLRLLGFLLRRRGWGLPVPLLCGRFLRLRSLWRLLYLLDPLGVLLLDLLLQGLHLLLQGDPELLCILELLQDLELQLLLGRLGVLHLSS
mmetsp:Transcript_2444/g.8956  ORF Transcript_2444/g.8956 Transcript_2444/m.8956 type:complete len:335 (-) Transcript_2444:4561-5565(-)